MARSYHTETFVHDSQSTKLSLESRPDYMESCPPQPAVPDIEEATLGSVMDASPQRPLDHDPVVVEVQTVRGFSPEISHFDRRDHPVGDDLDLELDEEWSTRQANSAMSWRDARVAVREAFDEKSRHHLNLGILDSWQA